MTKRSSFHSELAFILEMAAKSAASQLCRLVDEDSAELRLELSRALDANSALSDKIISLENELKMTRKTSPRLRISHRSVGVQTMSSREEDTAESRLQTTDGMFGQDWCVDPWTDRCPYSLQGDADSVKSSKKAVTFSDKITMTMIKQEDYIEDAANIYQQETLVEEAEENMAEEHEQLSVAYLTYGGGYSFDQNGMEIVSADDTEELSMQLTSISDTEEEALMTDVHPYDEEEEDDDDDDDDDDDYDYGDDDDDDDEDYEEHLKFLFDKKKQPSRSTSSRLRLELEPYKEKFPCRICGSIFYYKGSLTSHMKSHESTVCKICKQSFPHQTKHKCVPPPGNNKTCGVCGKTFAKGASLKTHALVHTGERPFTCPFCGRRFTQRGNLSAHLRIHTGERPFKCSKCEMDFRTNDSLNKHLMRHKKKEDLENEKGSGNEKSSKNEKRSGKERGSKKEKGSGNEKSSGKEKSSENEKGLRKERSLRNEKNTGNEKGSGKEKRSGNEKDSGNEEGLENQKSSRNEKSSENEKHSGKEKDSRNEKGSGGKSPYKKRLRR